VISALDVDPKIDIGTSTGDLGDAIRSALSVRIGHLSSTAKSNDLIEQSRMIDSDGDTFRDLREARRSVGMFDQRSTGLSQQEFFGKSCRSQSGGDHNPSTIRI
jgi:hypothetical protein